MAVFRIFLYLLLFCTFVPASIQKLQNFEDTLSKGFLYSARSLEDWEAGPEIKQVLPYYLSGYDKKNRPVTVIELGKWNIRSIFQDYGNGGDIVRAYLEQITFRIGRNSSWADATNGFVAIYDLDMLNVDQVEDPATVLACLKAVQLVQALFKAEESQIILLNMNSAAYTMFQIVSPFTNGFLRNVELYGTDKIAWITRLLKTIPRDQLPPWYGGSNEWRPLQTST